MPTSLKQRPTFTVNDPDNGADQRWGVNATFIGEDLALLILERHTPEAGHISSRRVPCAVTAAGLTANVERLPSWMAPTLTNLLADVDVTRHLLDLEIAHSKGNALKEDDGTGYRNSWDEWAARLELLAAAYSYPDMTSRAVALGVVQSGFAGPPAQLHTAVSAAVCDPGADGHA